MTASILFEITAADSHQQIVLPVIRQLRGRGIGSVVCSDCEVLRGRSDTAGLEREGVAYERLAAAPLPGPTGDWEKAAAALRPRIGPLLDRLRPNLVVVLNDRNFPSNEYVSEARRRRIPTMLVQESLRKDLFQAPPLATLFARWRRKLQFGVEEGLRHYGQGGCDTVAAWGETSLAYFRRVGVPADRIVITGNPRFDRLVGADFASEAAEIRRMLGCKKDDLLIVFLSSPIERMKIVTAAEKLAMLKNLLAWTRSAAGAKGTGRVRLAFKLHRGEDAVRFRQFLIEQHAEDMASVVEQPLYPLLAACNAALMFSTTAGLEAALLGKPVGQLAFNRPLDDWDLPGRGVAARIGTAGDLAEFLSAAGSDPKAGERSRKAAGAFVAYLGQATRQVTRLAEKLANQKTS